MRPTGPPGQRPEPRPRPKDAERLGQKIGLEAIEDLRRILDVAGKVVVGETSDRFWDVIEECYEKRPKDRRGPEPGGGRDR